METSHLIDCHVLTLPHFEPQWMADMRQDLDGEPVHQHWMPGIDGDLGAARAAGFAVGTAPFVTSQDPDDRLTPGTYIALLQALRDNPLAPFAWAREQLVDVDLVDLPMRPHVWMKGYHPLTHINTGTHLHGVKLYRRDLIMPLLDGMRESGLCCEFFTDFMLIKPHTRPPRDCWPVHVPMVGRRWRQTGRNGSRLFRLEHFDHMAGVLGFGSMDALRQAVVRANTT